MTSSFSVPGEMTLWSLRGVGRPEAPLGIYVSQHDLGRCDAAGELLAKGPTGHQNNAAAPPPPSLTARRGRPAARRRLRAALTRALRGDCPFCVLLTHDFQLE